MSELSHPTENLEAPLSDGTATGEPAADSGPSVVRSSGVMALGTVLSRITGFLRQAILAAAIGSALVGDGYSVANTLPNIIQELILGGILTSVVVPLLVKARQSDPDGGEVYAQRLLTLTTVMLAITTVLAVAAAPLLTRLYASGATGDNRALTTTLAYLLLPEIFFYGLFAMFSAILNSRSRFGAPMWTPVLNNVVVIATAAVFMALPGPASLTPSTISSTQVLVLGLGSTLGIAVQAVTLWPALRRAGFSWRWRIDIRNAGLGEARSLALWTVGYVAVSQVGVLIVTRLANGAAGRGGAGNFIYTNAQLLFMLPHGIVAVSLITALLPRMSRHAVEKKMGAIGDDLSYGTRLTATALIPITALMAVLAIEVATVVFGHGRTTASQAHATGIALALGTIGLVPYAISQMQLFVYYSMRDARTPVLINIIAVGVKIVFDVIAYQLVSADHVVAALMLGNTVSYVVAAAFGYAWLRRRLPDLHAYSTVRTVVRISVASVPVLIVALLLGPVLGDHVAVGGAMGVARLLVAAGAGGALFVLMAQLMHVREVDDVVRTVRSRLGR